MSKCSHARLKRKLIIEQGKDEGEYHGYCSQQCKKMIDLRISTEDILVVFPKGRPQVRK